MTEEKWNELLEEMLSKSRKVLGVKAGVYANDRDRFYNFKRTAEVNRCEPVTAAWGMASKHLIACIDIIENNVEVDVERIEEVFGDLRNYLFLIEGMLKEER